jgi:hypothetical protein
MDTDTTGIRELERSWAAAEQAGDTATLDALVVPGFQLVGPLGRWQLARIHLSPVQTPPA